jgi:hypothetical protein
MIFSIDEARDILRIDGPDNDAQIAALVQAIPDYLHITAGIENFGIYSPLARAAARFILQLWYYGESADTEKLNRTIDSLLKALTYER